MKQLKLFDNKIKTSFGGSLNAGKRKGTRPLDSKRPAHLIFKAEQDGLLLTHQELVCETFKKISMKRGMQIHSIAVNADHIHLVLSFPNRQIYVRWVRGITGVLTRKIPGLKWKLLPYSEIVNWGKHLAIVNKYVGENQNEAAFILRCHDYVQRWSSLNCAFG